MARLRPREKITFTGFTATEIQKMEKVYKNSEEHPPSLWVYRRLATIFNQSNDRDGKPRVKWTEVQRWFQDRYKSDVAKTSNKSKDAKVSDEKVLNPSKDQFEAKSHDGAWYDVDKFLSNRLHRGESEIRIRFAGFGADHDEWVNVNAVREQSIPYEDSECRKVKIGDTVLSFRKKKGEAKHYDACVMVIKRRVHTIGGCRCIFSIKYDHDNTEECVSLRSLSRQPI